MTRGQTRHPRTSQELGGHTSSPPSIKVTTGRIIGRATSLSFYWAGQRVAGVWGHAFQDLLNNSQVPTMTSGRQIEIPA